MEHEERKLPCLDSARALARELAGKAGYWTERHTNLDVEIDTAIFGAIAAEHYRGCVAKQSSAKAESRRKK